MCLVHYKVMGIFRLLYWKLNQLLECRNVSWDAHSLWLVYGVLLK